MKKSLLLCFALICLVTGAYATHYRAGELTYEQLSYLTYKVTVTTYTTDINVPPDSDTLTVEWGDGSQSTAFRNPPNGQTLGNNIKVNTYTAEHTYLGPLPYYIISVTDPNRINGIENINRGGSVNVAFYIEDTLRIYNPSFVGGNDSPILLNPPIDFANVNDTFYHNPAAYDPNGDSLTFELVPPLQATSVQVPNYEYPDQINPGIDNNFTIDSRTGEIVWAVPKKRGVYNIAILVKEYREGLLMGTVLRDMQIIVEEQLNNPPQLNAINDTCIVAGSFLSLNIQATDPDAGQRVYLYAAGGPLQVPNSPAVFTSNSNVGFATGTFSWATNCTHIRRQFYQVVFKAEDDYRISTGPLPLVDLETWVIQVVAPAPENVQAVPTGNVINVSWQDPYSCAATDNFIGFSVWRREGSNPFPIDTCETGLAGKGYVMLTDRLLDYTYVDSNVVRGKDYCYRILAEFADQSALGFYYNNVNSLPSEEACSELKIDLPVIMNASVEETDPTNGEIFVRWLNPIPNAVEHLDTNQFPGPYRYDLYRGTGFDTTGSILVKTVSSNTFAELDDTTFTDTGLNTELTPYVYYINFFSHGGDTLVGVSSPASSTFLTIGADDEVLNLSWEEIVPWSNFAYEINKQDNTSGLFVAIDTVFGVSEYADTDVVNDSSYCYFVRGFGQFTSGTLPQDTLFNKSQENCGIPVDTVAPCPPVLTAGNTCQSIFSGETCAGTDQGLFNELSWTADFVCADDIVKYYIYYAEPGVATFQRIDSTTSATDTSYTHSDLTTLAGCYIVTAVDEYGNESEFSNTECVGNCPCYLLPNVFTPNGDGDNDLYTPRMPYLFVARVEMKIFNRWGALVFETTDPDLNWDGNHMKTGKPLNDDVYYYVCKVFESTVDNEGNENYQVLNGYIHLIRGNGNSN